MLGLNLTSRQRVPHLPQTSVPTGRQVRIQEQFRSPEMRVDLVSVQFALHYGFESVQQAERMLQNVSDRLRPGGYFIATVPDGHAIM